jgi:hypothetical protein
LYPQQRRQTVYVKANGSLVLTKILNRIPGRWLTNGSVGSPRGAALHAMQLLTYRLREEGETFTPAAAVLVAQWRLIQAATTDYWWAERVGQY